MVGGGFNNFAISLPPYNHTTET